MLNGWPGFPTATLTIDVTGGPAAFSFTGPPSASGFLEFGVPTLAAGQVVSATDGTTIKELTIVPLSVQGNTASDELSGVGPASVLATVQAHCGPSSTSCVATRLLAADGAGDFATSLAPTVDFLGGSDLSASIAEADGDRQYAKVGPTALDTDRDGIGELIDLLPSVPSALFFVNVPLSVPTSGQVLSDGGLMVTVVHAIPPDGVIAAASGGAPGAIAQLELCPDAFVIDLTAGDVVTLTCSSLTAKVLSGPVVFRVPSLSAIASVPTGTTAKLSVLGSGELEVLNLAGTASISVTVDGVTTFIVPPLPTNKDQCKHGGWTAFGRFKNQGDCVSFVSTKGKNPPAR